MSTESHRQGLLSGTNLMILDDGRVTSVDALMILQAAIGVHIEIGLV